MGLDFTRLTSAVEAAQVEDDSEVTFARTRSRRQCTLRADISERMAVLELSLSDDVTLESRSCSDTEVTATREGERQLLTTRYDGVGRLGEPGRDARTVVVQSNDTRLRRGAERID